MPENRLAPDAGERPQAADPAAERDEPDSHRGLPPEPALAKTREAALDSTLEMALLEPLPPFTDAARARKSLAALERALGEGVAERALTAARSSPDPDRALDALERVLTAPLPRPPERMGDEALRAVAAVGAASDFLPRLLARRPRLLDWLSAAAHLHREKKRETYLRELSRRVIRLAPGDAAALMRALRRYKYREVLRIAARDLLGLGTVAEVTRELSALAEACLESAIPFLDAALRERHGAPDGAPKPGDGYCVLGMGKLGGRELNFSSDIDLICFYGVDGRTAGGSGPPVTHREHYARLTEQLARVIGEVTEHGFVFRVDLNLRPDGRSGPIVNALEGMESYYESFGRTWERAALLKARPCAGDLALGERLLEALAPFVWRRTVDHTTIEEMRSLKAQINRRAVQKGDDVKLGPGGIREIEFFAQALQLLHGGKNPRLRERSTLGALANALFAGLLAARDHDVLADAYVFLRRVEHRLQMIAERQTHALPLEAEARLRIARGAGFSTLAQFEAELGRHRANVGAIFGDILHATGAAVAPADPLLAAAVDPEVPEPARLEALAARGFRDPASALDHLARLARDRQSPFDRRGAPAPEAVRLLGDCATSPDPDLALFHLAELFATLRAPGAYFDLLARHPPTARQLTALLGSSDFLSKYFVRHPELIDWLVQSGLAQAKKGRAGLREELAARLSRQTDPEGRLVAMRRFKNEEVLRIGLNDVAGNLAVEEVMEELVELAEALLDRALELARAELVERYGLPRGPGGHEATLSVVGLGTLGARELGYQSDMDLIFVYSDAGETLGGSRGRSTNAEFFARLAQRLLSSLSLSLREGYLYRTDVRLRPSGNQGTLVVTARAFSEHQLKRAQLWERQALIRARRVAGDEALFDRVQAEVLEPAIFRPGADPVAMRAEIARVRDRMVRELSLETADQYNPKLGRGGLADIEFVAQFLQLAHGARDLSLRGGHTRKAIAALGAAGILSPRDTQVLEHGWTFLRRLENRLRIVHDHPLQHMPRSGPGLRSLARRLGYGGEEPEALLLADYAARTRAVRQVYERLLGA
jgi:glutamate-ammonia-ligase adenylyltransferase